MRRLALALMLALGSVLLAGCCFQQTPPACDPCSGGWAAPVYNGGCGGDQGVGRGGTGAFAR